MNMSLLEHRLNRRSDCGYLVENRDDYLDYAVADRAIAVSPVDGIKYRKRQETNKKLIPIWEEFNRIVASVRSQVYADTAKESADLIEFMGKAGLGQEECAGLCGQDINFNSERVVLILKP